MNSSLIGKIEKARRYAQEPDRVCIRDLKADFRGQHQIHHVEFSEGEWRCTCGFFSGYGTCSHTMAMQRLLGTMLVDQSESEPPVKKEAVSS